MSFVSSKSVRKVYRSDSRALVSRTTIGTKPEWLEDGRSVTIETANERSHIFPPILLKGQTVASESTIFHHFIEILPVNPTKRTRAQIFHDI